MPNIDNWVHKSKDMLCLKCMYFVLKNEYHPNDPDRRCLGRCRRHSPTLGGWPAVFTADWCGDHKLDSEKI